MRCELSVLLFLIVIFCCNKKDSSYFNIEKFVGDTLDFSDEYKKSNNSIIDTVKNNQNTNFRLYPEGKKLQLSFDYQIWLERDTFIVTHWHKSGDKWYVILKNGSDLFCNDVREIVE